MFKMIQSDLKRDQNKVACKFLFLKKYLKNY